MQKSELDFLTCFLVESDAIEGIDNDSSVVRKQFINSEIGIPGSLTGHAGALMLLRKRANVGSHLLDEGLVKLVQLFIVQEQSQKGERELPINQRGQWRKHDVVLARRNSQGEILSRRSIGADYNDVPARMSELLKGVAEWQTSKMHKTTAEEIVRFIARFHYNYERIHPFADGNGRSGRALVYFLYKYSHLEPFVFTHTDRHLNYYPCLAKEDSELMEQYFFDRSLATK